MQDPAHEDMCERLDRLEAIVRTNHLEVVNGIQRAGVPDDGWHHATARREADLVRVYADERIDVIAQAHEAAYKKGREELLEELGEVKEHSTALSLAAGVAAGRAAAVVEQRLSEEIGQNKTLVGKLQTTVEEVQGNVTVVLTALVTMQRTNMKLLGAAVLIGGVLIFILSRALGF